MLQAGGGAEEPAGGGGARPAAGEILHTVEDHNLGDRQQTNCGKETIKLTRVINRTTSGFDFRNKRPFSVAGGFSVKAAA